MGRPGAQPARSVSGGLCESVAMGALGGDDTGDDRGDEAVPRRTGAVVPEACDGPVRPLLLLAIRAIPAARRAGDPGDGCGIPHLGADDSLPILHGQRL